jgi:hypothetical protein
MCFGLFEDYSYGRAFQKNVLYFSNAVIQLGIGLRTFAHLFLKLSWRTLQKISLIIKECPEEILIKLAIVLKISKSSWNTVKVYV